MFELSTVENVSEITWYISNSIEFSMAFHYLKYCLGDSLKCLFESPLHLDQCYEKLGEIKTLKIILKPIEILRSLKH
jgi:hypothetical protein